jgi:hypothetical protein
MINQINQYELQHHQYYQLEQEHRGEHTESQQFAWRDPRQPTSFPLSIASSSNALPEARGDDNPSKTFYCDDYERAGIEEDRASSRGADTFEQGDLDSECVFAIFKQALAHSEQAVSEICSSNTLLVGSESATNKTIGDAISATATNICESYQKGMEAVAMTKTERTPLLQQPGEVAKSEEEGQHSELVFDTPSQHMMDCNLADSKVISSPNCMMANVRVASDELALQTATTALDKDEMGCDNGTHKGPVYAMTTSHGELFWQASERGNAINTIRWMCENPHLGWPIPKVNRLLIKNLALSSTECKRAPPVQPGLSRVLEDAMETAAKSGDPTWLALLAGWLQAMTNLQLDHSLCRSVPVELYVGWMLLFCSQSDQKHDRAGSYGGMPSRTSGGYIRAEKFLIGYNLERQVGVDEEIRSMFFRTDTLDYLPRKAAKSLTLNAVAGPVERAQIPATSSWEKMLPTIALYPNSTSTKQLPLVYRKGAKATGDEASITFTRNEDKKDRNEMSKRICAEVLTILTETNTQTFDQITTHQWEHVALHARSKLESKLVGARACWRNPDFAGAASIPKTRQSRHTAFEANMGNDGPSTHPMEVFPSDRDGPSRGHVLQTAQCEETGCLNALALSSRSGAQGIKSSRTENVMRGDLDFTHVFIDFKRAYSEAGRAVAEAWSRARLLAEPEANISAIRATAADDRKVDDDRKRKAIDERNSARSPLLRQPGKGTGLENIEEIKVRFIEPLERLMMHCEDDYSENETATYEEIMSSPRHKAAQMARAHDVPTSYGATTAAGELRRHLESRTHGRVVHVNPVVLEEFLRQSTPQGRASNSIAWMCKICSWDGRLTEQISQMSKSHLRMSQSASNPL